MSLGDIVSRSDAILKKYEKYVVKEDKRDDTGEKGPDPFMDEYAFIMQQADDLTLKAQANAEQHNRALRAAVNAEIRRGKTALLEGNLETLIKLVTKGKKLLPEVIQDRRQKVENLRYIIQQVPDGIHGGGRLSPTKKAFAAGSLSSGAKPVLNIEARWHGEGYFDQTEESAKFRQEWEISKGKQDKSLDNIERGLGTLGEMATAMGENLDHQDVLIDAVGEKMDDITKQLKTNNMKIHGLITQIRSTKHFCVDVILIVVLLSLTGVIVQTVVKK